MARWTASAKWAEGPAPDGQCAMPLALSLSEVLGSTGWTLKARVGPWGRNDAMPFAQRQEERWHTTLLRCFPPPLPKVRKQCDAGTAVGSRTCINDPFAESRTCRLRSAAVRRGSEHHRCRTAFVLTRLAMFEYSAPMYLDGYSEFSERQGRLMQNFAA